MPWRGISRAWSSSYAISIWPKGIADDPQLHLTEPFYLSLSRSIAPLPRVAAELHILC
jgi:hypothetical protein